MPRETRKSNDCPIFGPTCKIKDTVLPTYRDVIKYYLFEKHRMRLDNNNVECKSVDVIKNIARKILSIWSKASIPTVSESTVKQQIKHYYNTYDKMKRKMKKKTKTADKDLSIFISNSEKLFCIAACKCNSFKLCNCIKIKKVPLNEQEFLIDQRTNRRMVIGSIDKKETSLLKKKQTRLEKHQSFIKQCSSHKAPDFEVIPSTSNSSSQHVLSSLIDKSTSSSSPTTEESSSEFEDKQFPQPHKTSQMRLELPTVAALVQRTKVSCRAAAMIASATLKDVGLVSTTDKSHVIDKSKIRRAKNKNIMNIKEKKEGEEPISLEGLYFDGRKDDTIKLVQKGVKYHKTLVKEEHIVLVQEPGSKYIGFISPLSSTAEGISSSITTFLQKNNISISKLSVIGCDGTNVNTGVRRGIIRHLENKFNKPLQWSVCLLHANELPLRHLFHHLDGKTKGPSSFEGVLGKAIEKCEHLSIVEFEPVETTIDSTESIADLSTDQKYLLEMCLAVSDGCCSQELANKNPGKIAHSRWLTTANRLLRFYVACEEPSKELIELVKYIQYVYAPSWFNIKKNYLIKDGAKNLYKIISCSRYLRSNLKEIVDPVIQRNAFFAHPENLLLAMIEDENNLIRREGWQKILQIRHNVQREGIRSFHVPAINFHSKTYVNMIDWKKIKLTEPPLTRHFTDEEINNFLNNNIKLEFEVKFPCHSQAVERSVKLVTDAASTVYKDEDRHYYILNTLESRLQMPKFESKKHFLSKE